MDRSSQNGVEMSTSLYSGGNGTSFNGEAVTQKTIEKFGEYKYASLIRQYGSLLICVIGILGNCLSMLVLFQKHNRKISCYLYFGSIAIADNILLISNGMYQCTVDFFPEKINLVICRLINALTFGSTFASAYILFFVTLDR